VTHPVNVYAALGGHQVLRCAVELFSERLLDDPAVAGHFGAKDNGAWRRHQLEVLAAAVGGPQRNSAASTVAAPGAKCLTVGEFNRVLGHLSAALAEVGADERAIRDVIEAASQTRDLIVIAPESTHNAHLERTPL